MQNKDTTVNKKNAWPTKDAMNQIYEMNLWGGKNQEYYSGSGSHDHFIVDPYIATVKKFLSSFSSSLIVADLGCGDFNIGKNLVSLSKKYIAIDIVKNLIEYNDRNFKQGNLEFHCLDIAKDNLPKADCAIIRQVLQHLSNFEILKVIENISNFKYVLLTEHLPSDTFVPNKDIMSGQGIRIKKQSGVNLLAAPFNLKVKDEQQLLKINLENHKGVMVTTLYTLF